MYAPDQSTLVLSSDESHTLAQWNNVMITFWHGAVDKPSLRLLVQSSRELLQKYPDGIHSLGFVELGAPMPDAEAREIVSELMAMLGGRLKSEAIVISGDGFWAGAIRSLIMGFKVLSRAKHPQKVFGSVEEAVAWQSLHLEGLDSSQLLIEAAGLRDFGRQQRPKATDSAQIVS